jgi:uncharacterized protein YbbK (DUF523 family)
MGVRCRYDGASSSLPGMAELMARHTLIPVCPEQLGGLSTPREAAEIRDGGVFARSGAEVTEPFRRGAEEALGLARLYHCQLAILKERSPSCGYGKVYDGTFTGTLADGHGVAAALLVKNGVRVLGESRMAEVP